jgi:hypothetical protein
MYHIECKLANQRVWRKLSVRAKVPFTISELNAYRVQFAIDHGQNPDTVSVRGMSGPNVVTGFPEGSA